MTSQGISWCTRFALPTLRFFVSMRAQLALALDDFRRKLEIGFAADAFEIVHQDRLAVGRRLGDAHIARDHGVVDLSSHELPDIGATLVRQMVPRVPHHQHYALDRPISMPPAP